MYTWKVGGKSQTVRRKAPNTTPVETLGTIMEERETDSPKRQCEQQSDKPVDVRLVTRKHFRNVLKKAEEFGMILLQVHDEDPNFKQLKISATTREKTSWRTYWRITAHYWQNVRLFSRVASNLESQYDIPYNSNFQDT